MLLLANKETFGNDKKKTIFNAKIIERDNSPIFNFFLEFLLTSAKI